MNLRCFFCFNDFLLSKLQIHLRKEHNITDFKKYYLEHIKQEELICPICKVSEKKFNGLSTGFSKTCGNLSCRGKYINQTSKENQKLGCKKRNEKWKNEILEDGKTKQQQIIESGRIKREEKSEQTSLKISESLKKKDENGLSPIQKTFLAKYNVDNPMKLPETVLKLRKTFQEDYGVDWITKSDIIKEKSRKTILSIYGVDNFSKTEIQKEKNKIRYKIEIIKRILKYFEENKLVMLTDLNSYLTEKTPLRYKCISCNTEYEKCWNDIQSWWSCKVCNPNISTSSYELEIADFLISKNIIFQRYVKILENHRLELDFYIPSLNLAIEFDGLYWHSNIHQLNDNYHLQKTELCQKKGIRLIHIFEDEFVYKKDIVFARLNYILKSSTIIKIHGRKCKIKIIDSTIKNTFLDQNHIQGRDTSVINLGLFFNEELVSVITFSKGSISKGSESKDKVWELSRFCNKLNYSVSGSLSKLLYYFKKNFEWEEIFSYCDLRWNTGNSYIKAGFQLASILSPNYWYMNLSKDIHRYHRFKFRKSELKKFDSYKDERTEKEIMRIEGYSWIYDCGNLKFVMKK